MEEQVLEEYLFSCQMCGACCRNVSRWKLHVSELKSRFPELEISFPFNEVAGCCEHLLSDNKCAIYEDRPNICRTTYFYKLLSEHYNLSWTEFVEMQLLSCSLNRAKLNRIEDLE